MASPVCLPAHSSNAGRAAAIPGKLFVLGRVDFSYALRTLFKLAHPVVSSPPPPRTGFAAAGPVPPGIGRTFLDLCGQRPCLLPVP
jgi:hypothetical protein